MPSGTKKKKPTKPKDLIALWKQRIKESPEMLIPVTKQLLRGANLRGVKLRGADLRETDLKFCDFTDADLRGADLRGANLAGATLHSAQMQMCDLRLADLTGADFTRAHLEDAKLAAAKVQGITLRGAFLSEEQFDEQMHIDAGHKKCACCGTWDDPEEFVPDYDLKFGDEYEQAICWECRIWHYFEPFDDCTDLPRSIKKDIIASLPEDAGVDLEDACYGLLDEYPGAHDRFMDRI